MQARPFAGAVLAVLLGAAAGRASDQKSIAEIVAASKDHTILLAALKETGLFVTLQAKGSFTLFAPTDAAFRELGEETIAKALSDKESLRKLLAAHAVAGRIHTLDELKAGNVKEVNGFAVAADKDAVKVGGAKLVPSEAKCNNGVLHVIDKVLVPAK